MSGLAGTLRPFTLRFSEPLVSQEEIDEMMSGSGNRISMSKVSPTHTATGPKYDITPDDE